MSARAEGSRRGSARSGRSSGRIDALSTAVGTIFRAARETQRLSQEQVAALTTDTPWQVSRTTISAIECGRCLPGLETLVSLARVLHIDPAEVLEQVDIAHPPEVGVDVSDMSPRDLLRRAEERFWAADFRGALALLEAMSDRLLLDPTVEDRERRRLLARMQINRSCCLRQCGALRAARSAAERAMEHAEGVPELQAEGSMLLASLYSQEGLGEMARAAADLAVRLAGSGGPKLRGQVWSQRGNVLFRAGDAEQARRAFIQARKFALEADDRHNVASLEGNIGACLMDLGRTSQARARFLRAVELARECDDPALEASWVVELGELALLDGEFAEADRLAEAALRIVGGSGLVLTIFRAEWLRFAVARGRAPGREDARRLGRLKKLFPRVRRYRRENAVRKFAALISAAHDEPDGGTDE